MIRKLWPLAVFMLLLSLLAIGLQLNPRVVPSPLIGKSAPDFDLPDLVVPANRVASADFGREVVLLNVWASWCSGCRREHPLLLQLATQTDARLYGLNYKDTRTEAVDWLDRNGDPYRAIAFDRDGRVGIDYGVYGVPETYIIGRDGRVKYKHTGPITRSDLDDVIIPLLKELEHGQA